MAAPQSPRLVQKAAVDALSISLLDTFHGKEEPPEGGEPRWPIGTMLVMKKEADAEADVVDMSNWPLLDAHIREQFNLERDTTKMLLVLHVDVKLSGVTNPIHIKIDNASALYMFRRSFEVRMSLAEVLAIDTITMTVEQKAIQKLVKAAQPRKGKHATTEKKLRDLSVIIYGEDSAKKQQPEGEWGEECDLFMAKHPVRTHEPLTHPPPMSCMHSVECPCSGPVALAEGAPRLLPRARGRAHGARHAELSHQPEALPLPLHQEGQAVHIGLIWLCLAWLHLYL